MSSYPLPALDIRPNQQQESPLDSYAKVLQMKGLMGQQQLQQQELQKGQLDIQNRQAGMKAMQQWDGKSYEDVPDLLKKNGADLSTVMEAKQKILEQKQKLSSMAKDDAETGAKNLETLKSKNDLAVGALNSLDKVPDEQLAQSLAQSVQGLTQQGTIDPQHAQMAMQLAQQGDPQKIRQGLDLFKKSLTGNAAQIDEAQKAAQARSENATADLSEQKATQMKQFGGLSPEMIESKYAFLDAQKAQGKKIAPADEAWMKGVADYKKIVPVANFNLQNALPQGQNGQPSAMAQAVANGTMKWQDVISPRTPMSVKAAFAKEVNAINPDFNTQTYEISKKVTESFTSGDYSKQLNAINTARNHMQTFSQLADALNNGDVQAANKIGNAFGVQFGSDKATNFKIASQAFGGEVGKAFDGAGVTQSERESAAQAFNPNMSPQQFQGAVKTVDNLLQGKQNALKQTFEQGRKAQPNFGQQQSGMIRARDPQGKLHEAPAGTALPQGWTKE